MVLVKTPAVATPEGSNSTTTVCVPEAAIVNGVPGNALAGSSVKLVPAGVPSAIEVIVRFEVPLLVSV